MRRYKATVILEMLLNNQIIMDGGYRWAIRDGEFCIVVKNNKGIDIFYPVSASFEKFLSFCESLSWAQVIDNKKFPIFWEGE